MGGHLWVGSMNINKNSKSWGTLYFCLNRILSFVKRDIYFKDEDRLDIYNKAYFHNRLDYNYETAVIIPCEQHPYPEGETLLER